MSAMCFPRIYYVYKSLKHVRDKFIELTQVYTHQEIWTINIYRV